MTGSTLAVRKPVRRLPVLLAAGLAFLALVSLGTWQLQRLQWKEALLAEIDQRIHSKPAPLSDVIPHFWQTEDVDYLPVTATGTFDNTKEQYFFATYNGATGYFVYTPLLLEGFHDARLANYEAILVNRGFIPYERKDPGTRAEGLVEGQVTITGLARNPLGEKPSRLVPDNDPEKNIYYWKDMVLMAQRAGIEGPGLVPFFIDANDAPNPGGLPIGGVTIIDLPNNHLQYAVTWYGLAAALIGVVLVLLRRKQ